ncbi:hypothetical protein [Enterococcus sp. 2201sp1_2201st1_B8_2201SCRN_220225]|uniref:hypothetical protein n=1 Tax=unclassified Enterococcus TaxID=2608891 RepID=UPI0034A12FBF
MRVYLNGDGAELAFIVINDDEKWYLFTNGSGASNYIDVDDEDYNPESLDASDLFLEEPTKLIWELQDQGYEEKDED